METLKEISRLLAGKHLGRIEVLNHETLSENYYSKFYHGLKNGIYRNDEEAAKDIYRAKASDKKYLMLKKRLKEKMLNTLFFLDVDSHNESDIHKAYYKVIRDLHCAKILLVNGARNSAIEIIKSTLAIAIDYQFSEVAYSCAKLLRNHASLTGSRENYEQYYTLAGQWLKLLEAESISEHFFESIRMEFVRSVAVKPGLIRHAEQYLKKLRQLARAYDSWLLHFNMYRIWLMLSQMKGNYKESIKVCTKAQQFLNNHRNFYSDFRMAELALTKLECCLYLKDYRNGSRYAEECRKLLPEGTTYWLVFLEYWFLLAMHTENYRQAKEVLNRAVQHPKFAGFSPERHEKWKIFEAYLQWVLNGKEKKDEDFHLYKFLNEVPIYSRDKKGYNVAILVAQLLFWLDSDQYSRILDRHDTLKSYRSNYLKEDASFRSNCFIRMLLIMMKLNFEYEPTLNGTRYCLRKMQERAMNYQGTLETLEVIPYELLWEKILERLKNKKRAERSAGAGNASRQPQRSQ